MPRAKQAFLGLGGTESSLSHSVQVCEACREEAPFEEIFQAKCQHLYCQNGVKELFTAAITDESLFPPRCCRQPINLDAVQTFLNAKIVIQFEEKKVEFETPNRTYCSSPTCSSFVPVDCIHDNVARCRKCGTTTCVACKAAAHDHDCTKDETLEQVLRVANDQGWQRCYSCQHMVELEYGCNHMT